MGASKSKVIGKSGVGAAQIYTQTKEARARGLIPVRMVQNVLLIWLDSNINDNDVDCRNTLAQLRRVINTIGTYTDGDQCVQFLRMMADEKTCMIISGSLGQYIVPQVHDMPQVDTIFIFCGNKKLHEQWVKQWPKIKGVFTEITPICEALKRAAQQCEQDAMPISFMATSGEISKKNLNQLEPSFMYTQILKEILLDITFEPKHFQGFIESCREALVDNDKELKIVQKLERQYCEQTPIWWYTYPSFLYSMLNRALRVMDGNMIIQMGFFIDDLHRHIEQLHEEQFRYYHSSKVFTVYRGQGISLENFKQMSNTKGGLISFNNFLSTSRNPKIALEFAHEAMTRPEMIGILFVMTIDPAKSTTPFASITDVSYFKKGEDEVLFCMHTVFRIRDVTHMGGYHRLYQVILSLTSDEDKDLRLLTDRIREETFPNSTGWFRLGLVLLKMGQSAKAQEVYEILLEQATDEDEKGRIYETLGHAHNDRGCYQEAITFHEKSLEIRRKTLHPTHLNLAMSYNNIGLTYYSMGDYAKALSSHEKALAIRQQSLPPNHPDLAMSYNNIGNVYDNMGDYAQALSSHKKALGIQQQSLPPNHPHLAISHGNIGLMYNKMGDYAKVLSSHEKALAIQQQSLPPNHPDLAMSYNNIGNVYENIGDYAQALSFHTKALAIRQQSLPPNHPHLAISYGNIGLMYNKMGDYAEALSSHAKALAIQQQSLPPNHPDLAMSYNNIGNVHDHVGDYTQAISYYEKALVIRQQSLPPNHPDLAMSYGNFGLVYHNVGDYAKARSYSERAVKIGQQSLPPNHPHLQFYKKNLEIVKK